jgi:competence protein ComEC
MAIYSWIPIAILDLFRDGLVSPFTPVLSLLTIPPLTLVLYPLTLLSHALTGGVPPWVFFLWHQSFKGLLFVLDLFPTVFSVSWTDFLICSLSLSLIHRFSRRLAPGFGLILILLLSTRYFFFPNSKNQVVQLNVGQGDSALIQEGAHAELVDAGPESPTGAEGWIRKLGRYGVTRVDGVLLTHLDQDHAGGLHSLLSALPVRCLEVSTPHQRTQKGRAISSWVHSLPGAPVILSSGCIQLSKVGWFRSRRSGAKGNEWMAGIVRKITERDAYFSLGDGDFAQEREFANRFRREIISSRYRIWKVGHHGSRFSSDFFFLSKLNPKELWISVGRKNRYHHPSSEAMARIQLSGGLVHRTDREGDLVYRAEGSI